MPPSILWVVLLHWPLMQLEAFGCVKDMILGYDYLFIFFYFYFYFFLLKQFFFFFCAGEFVFWSGVGAR
jgi:hypothetical protein